MGKLIRKLTCGNKASLKVRLQELESQQDERCTSLEKRNKELYEESIILKREKDELLSRLSKVCGDQMTKDNPAIADLSNQNRPTKLGERWSTIYTDEWTDAYEELRHDAQRNQPKTIEKQLLDIVVICYKSCHEIAEEQMKKARISMNGFEHYIIDDSPMDRNRNMVSPSLLPRTTRVGEMFIDEVISNYKERRKHDIDWVQSVQKKLVHLISQKGIQLPQVLAFTSKCAELCWFMCIQDPPLAMEYENFEGKPVDRSKFNLYDRNGTITEFVVWPALLLHKNGPILTKGVVQPVETNKHPPGYSPPQINPIFRAKRGRAAIVRRPRLVAVRDNTRIQSSRFPDNQYYSCLQVDRTSKSSGNVREPQKQGIMYYNEKANLLQQDRLSLDYQAQYPFSYNLSNTKEINVQLTPRSCVSYFEEPVSIRRNRTSSLVTHNSQMPDFSKAVYGTQRINVTNQTAV